MVRCALMEECDRRMTKLGRVEQAGGGWSRLEQAGRVLEIIIIVTELTLHSGQHCLFDKLSRSEQHNYQSFIYLHSRERKTNSEKVSRDV